MARKIPAATSFTALGIPEEEWTKAMRLAVKQRWTDLPVLRRVADLRVDLEAVQVEATPSADEIREDPSRWPVDTIDPANPPADEVFEAEAARLLRNARVNAWRERGRLTAAIEARDLKFARMRAGKKAVPAPANPTTASVAALLP